MVDSPWGPLAIRDAHIHFFSRTFFDILATQKGSPIDSIAQAAGIELPPQDPTSLAQRWVHELDGHGVECAALIASVPGDHQSVATAVQAFPNLFRGYFMLNPMAPSALAQAEAGLDSGLRGICLFPAMHGYSMADAAVESVVRLAGERRAVVFVHCGVLSVGIRGKLGLASPFDLRNSNPVDLQAVAQRHPGVPFVIPHFGAGYLREALMVASMCPNVYLDTSSTNRWMRFESLSLETVFPRALDVLGPERLLFGSDSSFFPRGWVGQVARDQMSVLHQMGVPKATAAQIFGENFLRLFDNL
jgi:uncharacterized protein